MQVEKVMEGWAWKVTKRKKVREHQRKSERVRGEISESVRKGRKVRESQGGLGWNVRKREKGLES